MTRQKLGWRLLILSDQVREALYSSSVLKRCEGIDLVISCGDLPFSYLEYIATMIRVPLLYVPGNHDHPIHTAEGRTIESPEGAVNIDGRVITLKHPNRHHLTVAGLGGSMPCGGFLHQYSPWEMRKRVAKLECHLLWNRLLKRRSLDILVTHAPPLGIHDGQDPCHVGFHSFLGMIRRQHPSVHVHGHMHPAYGYDTKVRMYHGTEIRNIYGYEYLEIPQ